MNFEQKMLFPCKNNNQILNVVRFTINLAFPLQTTSFQTKNQFESSDKKSLTFDPPMSSETELIPIFQKMHF